MAEACAGDDALRAEVESLLAAHREAGGTLRVAAAPAESTATDPEPVMPGRRFGPYQVLRRVAQGGMAAVYLAVRADDEYRKRVAIKVIPPGLDTEDLLRRFRSERQTLAALDHPNIVKLLDGGTTEDHLPYLVMDYVEGTPITEYCDTHRFTITERLQLFQKVCEAVSYAHQRLVIHRDLKPGNILVTAEGIVKLLDFGIAKLLNPTALGEMMVTTGTGTRLMTPEYASPEQVRGEPLTNATDTYSLGVILFELLTGYRPYHMNGHTVTEIVHAICEEEPAKPSAVVTRVQRQTSPYGTTTLFTPEEISRTREVTPQKLRKRLEGDLDTIVLAALRKEPQRRYASVYEFSADIGRHLDGLAVAARPATITYRTGKLLRRHKEAALAALVATILVGGVATGVFLYPHRAHGLGEKDTIVLSDFDNKTGDPVFEGTLRQALTVDLEQSPFLNILPERKIAQTLQLMGRKPDQPLTAAVADELCQRVGSKAMLVGSITKLGGEYVIGLSATNCATGDSLAVEQVRAEGKEHVLQALDAAATSLRTKLGESLASVQSFDQPLEQATTSSLEALQSFTRGNDQRAHGKEAESIPLYKHAIELDPTFALAHSKLGLLYSEMGQSETGQEHLRRAFELRERVSEREKFYISGLYYSFVTGETEKEIETYQLWEQTYPRDWYPHNGVAVTYRQVGQFDRAVQEAQEALRLEPNQVMPYGNLTYAYMDLNRFDEVKAICSQAMSRGLEPEYFHWILYEIAFIKGDFAAMKEQVDWNKSHPEEYTMRSLEASVAASSGQLNKARQFFQQAVELADSHGLTEASANIIAEQAWFEARFDNDSQARRSANQALAISRGRDVEYFAAYALARGGDLTRVRAITDDLVRRFPQSTLVNRIYVPVLLATMETRRGNAGRALELLQSSSPYELGEDAALTPVYVRGEAYLQMHEGQKAAEEFQTILDHRGGDPFDYSLAHLSLARAYVGQGDTAKARAAYQVFFALWKDADPDIPILEKAKAEYAALQ